MSLLEDYKKSLKRNKKNRNYCFVKIKSNHSCGHCGTTIKEGTECLTINKRHSDRMWVCDDCLSLKLSIVNTKGELNCVAFGDEGASMALMDYLNELEAEFLEKRRY